MNARTTPTPRQRTLAPIPSRTRRPSSPLAPTIRRRPPSRRHPVGERIATIGSPLKTLAPAGGLFVVAALASSSLLSLSGSVALESLRRRGIEADSRMRVEVALRRDLKANLSSATSPAAVESWAGDHGMLPPDAAPSVAPGVPSGRTLVARR